MSTKRPELLAPAGGPEAGWAALAHGADAVYAGLARFSARAEAENFTPEALGELVAYAHSLQPARRVYLTLNTLLFNAELPEALAGLAGAVEAGVDAVIVQDLGLARLVRGHFPSLRLHASTQLAVHDAGGVRAAAALGFRRVVLARELTRAEVRRCADGGGAEVEVFVHGALCYAYSGLCLCSALLAGSSGNRGRCKYPCRGDVRLEDGSPAGFAFSMKDLALLDGVGGLAAAGVAALKIEGRMKTPAYVAAVTALYRRLLDGQLPAAELAECAEDLRTFFARPWTRLYVDGRPDGAVVEPERLGHRGVPVGRVEAVRGPRDDRRLRFRTARALEKHDGLQVEVPGLARPFGFAVQGLWEVGPGGAPRPVVRAPAGALVEVLLPPGAPDLPAGTAVCCASSLAARRLYTWSRPRPGVFRPRHPVEVELDVGATQLRVRARLAGRPDRPAAEAATDGDFAPAREPGSAGRAARQAFEKLGETPLCLEGLVCRNPQDRFVPVSFLNDLRRRVAEDLAAGLAAARERRAAFLREAAGEGGLPPAGSPGGWILKIDAPETVSAFTAADWAAVRELTVCIDSLDPEAGAALAAAVPGGRVRAALPAVIRDADRERLAARLRAWLERGQRDWEVGGLGGWRLLNDLAGGAALDVAADWTLYALNRQAVLELAGMGAGRVTLSPEDTPENTAALLGAFGDRAAVIVREEVPLFLSATRPALPGPAAEEQAIRLGGRPCVVVGRGGLTVTVPRDPYVPAADVEALRQQGARWLRAAFLWRRHEPAAVRDWWRRHAAGPPAP